MKISELLIVLLLLNLRIFVTICCNNLVKRPEGQLHLATIGRIDFSNLCNVTRL